MNENKPIKIGYARLKSPSGEEQYIAFRELSLWEESQLQSLKEALQAGGYELYCACSPENNIPLTITVNNIIRVKNNLQQDKHKESCPKSIRYAAWLRENKTGTEIPQDSDKMIFQVTLPGVNSGSSSSSSSSSTSSTGEAQPKMKLYAMVRTLNLMAWEKQTYSIKKKIAIARREGLQPTWSYKDIKAFNQLIYGISHDIFIQTRTTIQPFSEMYYNKQKFCECVDYKTRFFIYACLEKIIPYKAERVYQYLTLKIPGKETMFKLPVRMKTDKFKQMIDIEDIPNPAENNYVVAGWMNHTIFKLRDGSIVDWANLLQGVVLEVSENGLVVENEQEKELMKLLCEESIIFKKPYQPIENYGSAIPSFLIEFKDKKNIIIDVVDSKTYAKRAEWGVSNEEFYCIFFTEEDEAEEIIEKIKEYAAT